jgi:hypothetical protein
VVAQSSILLKSGPLHIGLRPLAASREAIQMFIGRNLRTTNNCSVGVGIGACDTPDDLCRDLRKYYPVGSGQVLEEVVGRPAPTPVLLMRGSVLDA